MNCNFSDKTCKNKEGVRMDLIKIGRSRSFWYLDSIIQDHRKLMEDVTNRIKVGWVKWRGASRVLCDCRIPLRLKC